MDWKRWPYGKHRPRVAVVGDVMLDVYHAHVESGRKDQVALGGAGNAAANLAALGAQVVMLGVVGNDDGADSIRTAAPLFDDLRLDLVVDSGRPTTTKEYVRPGVRRSRESTRPLDPHPARALAARVTGALDHVEGLLLSDYGKGVLRTPEVEHAATDYRMAASLDTVVLDPCASTPLHLLRYADFATPNGEEFRQLQLRAAARPITRTCPHTRLVVTVGRRGAVVLDQLGRVDVATEPVVAGDPTGAGDTFAAALLLAKVSRLDDLTAVRLANVAAGITCRKQGTATCSRCELLQELDR